MHAGSISSVIQKAYGVTYRLLLYFMKAHLRCQILQRCVQQGVLYRERDGDAELSLPKSVQ